MNSKAAKILVKHGSDVHRLTVVVSKQSGPAHE